MYIFQSLFIYWEEKTATTNIQEKSFEWTRVLMCNGNWNLLQNFTNSNVLFVIQKSVDTTSAEVRSCILHDQKYSSEKLYKLISLFTTTQLQIKLSTKKFSTRYRILTRRQYLVW